MNDFKPIGVYRTHEGPLGADLYDMNGERVPVPPAGWAAYDKEGQTRRVTAEEAAALQSEVKA